MPVIRLPIRLEPDPRRVIARKVIPGDEDRIRSLIERVLRLSDAQVEHMLNTEFVVNTLKAQFTIGELNRAIRDLRTSPTDPAAVAEAAETMLWLARSNYQLRLPEDADVSEVVIFPHSETESHGIEDARFVKFTDDDGSHYYYGTYTAYNGYRIMPQLFEITTILTSY